jgi:hypothetical protein
MIGTRRTLVLLLVLTLVAAICYFVLRRTRRAETLGALCGLFCNGSLVLICLLPFLRLGLLFALPAVLTFAARTLGRWRALSQGVERALDVSVVLAGLALPIVFGLAYFED